MPSNKTRSTQFGDQSPPGDHTAREKQRLEAEHAEEQAEAAKRMATVSERNAQVTQHGIHDPKTGEVLTGPEVVDDEDETDEREGGGTDDIHDLESAEGPPSEPTSRSRPRRQALETQRSETGMAVELLDDEEEIEQEIRIGRVNTDLDSMTFGHGNTFNFQRGKKYRMPKALYEHLDERGYIYH